MRVDARDAVTGAVVEAAITVHRALGPGLLESVYQAAMAVELRASGIGFESQCELPVRYRGVLLPSRLRLDLVVAGRVIVELKSVQELHPIHRAQVLTYLKLSGFRRALLINFNVVRLVDGVVRVSL